MDDHLLRFQNNKMFVFIDFETLNLCLSFANNLPWQVAMIRSVAGKEVESKSFYIKWDTHLQISDGAAKITRYSQTTVDKQGVTPDVAFKAMYNWLDSADYIVGHNILGFDLYLLRDYCKMMGKPYEHLTSKILDTNALAKSVKYDLPFKPTDRIMEHQYRLSNEYRKGIKTNLKALGKENNIEHDYETLHEALSDLRLNLKVWNCIKFHISI